SRSAKLSSAWETYAILAPLPEQKFAAGFDHRNAVVSDDVGRGVGFAPQFRQIRAGAEHVDRDIGSRHHAAFGGSKARTCNDLDRAEPGLVQCAPQQPYCRRRDTGADEVTKFLLSAISTNRVRRVMLQNRIRASWVEALAITAAGRIDADGELARSGEFREAARDCDRIRGLLSEVIDQHSHRLVREDLAEHLRGAHG